MLEDDTRIQLDLQQPLHDRQDPARHDAAQVRARIGAVFIDFPRDAESRPHAYSIDFYYSGTGRERAGSAASLSARTPPDDWIYTACEGQGRKHLVAEQGPVARRSREDGDQRRRFPTIWSTSRTASSSARPISATATRAGTGMVHYPINNYDVSLNIGNYVHFSDQARRSAARFLRAARGSGEGEEAVRAGQRDARSLPALLRRLSRSRRTATS